jgi:transglutaminase-like putative cysteine protease
MQLAFGGGVAQDPSIFLLYAALLTWGVAFFAGWWSSQGRNALTGFVPLLTLSSLSTFYTGRLTLAFVLGLFSVLVLTAVGDIRSLLVRWSERGVDCAVDLDFNTALTAVRVALVIVLLGAYLPNIDVQRVTQWVRDTLSRPRQEAELQAERLFGGVRPPHRRREGPEDTEDAGDRPGHLPRVHLLGGPPDLQTTEAFRVWAEDVPAPYWRGLTFDYYTGRGWLITVEDETPISTTVPISPAITTQSIGQRVRLASERGGTLYALAEPILLRADAQAEITAINRRSGDLGGLTVAASHYKVISLVPRPTPQELRAAPPDYPAYIADLYLELPESVPERVQALAREVVSDSETPYEQVIRLEQYLRGFPYTVDIESPPPDRDVADYFLFDLGEGYCDYYATAFVVMARSVGIPSRLAVGYVGGYTDPEDDSIVLVEANGHSWPEVFFNQWGWIAFEPTGARLELEYLMPGAVAEEIPAEDLPERPSRPFRFPAWTGAALGILVLTVAGVWAWRWRHRKQEGPLNLTTVWQGLVLYGARLGVDYATDQTVLEFADALMTELSERARAAHVRRGWWKKLASETQSTVMDFAQAYSNYLYGGGPDLVKPDWAIMRRPIARFRWVGLGRQWVLISR